MSEKKLLRRIFDSNKERE